MDAAKPSMSPSEYLALAEETLEAIEDAIAQASSDLDIECDRSGNVLEIGFPDDSKIIVNTQEALQEIWVAARAGGFHYRWNGDAWIDTRSGKELFDELSKLASAQAHARVVLRG